MAVKRPSSQVNEGRICASGSQKTAVGDRTSIQADPPQYLRCQPLLRARPGLWFDEECGCVSMGGKHGRFARSAFHYFVVSRLAQLQKHLVSTLVKVHIPIPMFVRRSRSFTTSVLRLERAAFRTTRACKQPWNITSSQHTPRSSSSVANRQGMGSRHAPHSRVVAYTAFICSHVLDHRLPESNAQLLIALICALRNGASSIY